MDERISELLLRTRIAVSPETFFLVSLLHDDCRKLLENLRSNPRMTVPFMVLMDRKEVTLILDEPDLKMAEPFLNNAKIASGYRLLTFDIELDLTVVGFLAEVALILAEASIPIMALSAFSRDHLLIKQADLASALKALGDYVDEIC